MKKRHLALLILLLGSCSLVSKKQETSIRPKTFVLPEVPNLLTTPEDRAAYLSVHYWDHFDFSDTANIHLPEVSEQAFVNFINILPYSSEFQTAVDTLYRKASANRKMLDYFIGLADKYLYEPNSPMYDETLYISVLRSLLAHSTLPDVEKIRPQQLLNQALKNRPGSEATDFKVQFRNGTRKQMRALKAPFLILYFNDPTCDDCIRVKKILSDSDLLNRLLKKGMLQLLSVCVEGVTESWKKTTCPTSWLDVCDPNQDLIQKGLYDLKAMPTLYLLDANKKVLLKDATAAEIVRYFENGVPSDIAL